MAEPAFLHNQWYVAATAAEIGRTPFARRICNQPMVMFRRQDGGVVVLEDRCAHRKVPLSKGELIGDEIQCGYHGWTYALDGRLKTTPEFDGVEEFDRASCRLPQFRAEVWNELVFVNLDPAAESLTDFLGELLHDMPPHDYRGFRLAHRKTWELDCNWKVYVDNYLEGYHIPIVHPGLFRELDYPSYRTDVKRNYSIQIAPTRRPERIRTSGGDDQVRYFWIFPNLMLNVYPDNFSTNLIVPIGPNRTATLFDWYFRDPDAAKPQIDETVAFSDEIQIEDIDICEAVQRGLRSSTYERGRFSPQRENGVHHFHCLYQESMSLNRA